MIGKAEPGGNIERLQQNNLNHMGNKLAGILPETIPICKKKIQYNGIRGIRKGLTLPPRWPRISFVHSYYEERERQEAVEEA
jgi:hypothetical protein